ncbi:MAG: hypothetical protein NTZ12_10580 [Candidatus Aminicenantes bacterium]|nr:hypothetical protein [Candidatus Aminicenantes bacterium]
MKIDKHLIVSGVLFTVVLVAWPVMTALARPSGNVAEQLRWVADHLPLFKAQFFLAFLLAPAIVYMMLAQLAKLQQGESLAQRFGMVFIAAYVVLNSIAYAAQAVLVPRFIAAGQMGLARAWYFASPASIAYFVNQLGYCFWAIGAIVLFAKVQRGHGLPAFIASLYLLSALLSFMAFAGLLLDNRVLNNLTMPSGLALLPVGILSVIWGWRRD